MFAFVIAALAASKVFPLPQSEAPAPGSRWILGKSTTLAGVGRAQAAAVHEGKVYVLGDADTGVIVEFDFDLQPTGRRIALTRNRRDLLSHPTGLAFHPRFGVWVGDSPAGLFGRGATLYQIDWERALAEGTLDDAVRAVVNDDAARAGTRPVFVRSGSRWLLATADYARHGQVRLYDPEKLVAAGRSAADGVVVGAFALEGYTQSLVWEDETGWLYIVQNPRRGRGWRVLVVDLEKALVAGRADTPPALIERIEWPLTSELEGLALMPGRRVLFLTSDRENNARSGRR